MPLSSSESDRPLSVHPVRRLDTRFPKQNSLPHFATGFMVTPRPAIDVWALRAARVVLSCVAGLIGAWIWTTLAQTAEQDQQIFPPALTQFTPAPQNPLFQGRGSGHWDHSTRERGWVVREAPDKWHLWFTGYDGTRTGVKHLGYAKSTDGLAWTRFQDAPIHDQHWVEDVCVVRQGSTWHMFAEGEQDRAHLLTSPDGINWEERGPLDIRHTNGKPIEDGPYGTPSAWYENDTWYLFYERYDLAVWLATSKDLKVFTNVREEPVLLPGPEAYDRELIAVNQILKRDGRYYMVYHGTNGEQKPAQWSTNLASSTDLLNWRKAPRNPLLPIHWNKSSGQLVYDGERYRLYTAHVKLDVFMGPTAAE